MEDSQPIAPALAHVVDGEMQDALPCLTVSADPSALGIEFAREDAIGLLARRIDSETFNMLSINAIRIDLLIMYRYCIFNCQNDM